MKKTLAIVLILTYSSYLFGQGATRRKPVPTDTAQADATKLIKEVYGDSWANAKTEAEKQALAKKLLEKANETKDDPTSRFVLLRLAREIATQIADGPTAFQAIDAMAEAFQVDVFEMKSAALTKFATAAQKPAQHQSVSEEALKLLDQAVSQDNFAVADEFGKLALTEARKAHEKELLTQAQNRIAEVAELTKACDDAKAARITLKKTPDDPESNLVVGKYLCFVKGDWEKGLPMLALGKDAALKALATLELDGVASSTDQAKLGDGWWDLGEKLEGLTQKQIQTRAAYWYEQALPGLSGFVKDKIEKRLKDVNARPTYSIDQAIFLADFKAEKAIIAATEGQSPQEALLNVRIHGKPIVKGLWAHPPKSRSSSQIAFNIEGKYRQFSGTAAIADTIIGNPDHKNPASPLTFRIIGDGRLLWKSRPMKSLDSVDAFQVTVAGIKTLELFVDCPGDWGSAWAVWVDPILKK